jgi:hypothetical protein
MPVEVNCPSCGTVYLFSDHLLGRTAPCRECEHFLTVSRHPVADNAEDQPAPKKKRECVVSNGLGWKLPLALGALLLFVGGGVALVLALAGEGRGPALAGNWQGSPEVREIVNRMAKGKMPALAGNLAGALLQKAADELLAVNIEFAKDGTVSFSGNTGIIGVAEPAEGTWEIVERDGKTLTVWIVLRDTDFEARLAFHKRNTFTFSRLDQNGQSIVFVRSKE